MRDDASGSTSGASPKLISATLALLAATVAMSVWAAPIQRYTAQAAAQLLDREAYARAVLGEAGLGAQTTRPYGFPAARDSAPGAAPAGEGGK